MTEKITQMVPLIITRRLHTLNSIHESRLVYQIVNAGADSPRAGLDQSWRRSGHSAGSIHHVLLSPPALKGSNAQPTFMSSTAYGSTSSNTFPGCIPENMSKIFPFGSRAWGFGAWTGSGSTIGRNYGCGVLRSVSSPSRSFHDSIVNFDHPEVSGGLNQIYYRSVSSSSHENSGETSELSEIDFHSICDETLESMTEKFDALADSSDISAEYDVSYSQGVLTVKFGDAGTYVINKQSPNKQIWLSSPSSGPKRYDFISGVWIYRHDRSILHNLLRNEVSKILDMDVDFTECSYGKA